MKKILTLIPALMLLVGCAAPVAGPVVCEPVYVSPVYVPPPVVVVRPWYWGPHYHHHWR